MEFLQIYNSRIGPNSELTGVSYLSISDTLQCLDLSITNIDTLDIRNLNLEVSSTIPSGVQLKGRNRNSLAKFRLEKPVQRSLEIDFAKEIIY